MFPSLHIDTWKQVGDDIIGEGDWFGSGICLSKDGSILAVGGPQNDVNGVMSGLVRVFKWSGEEWIQRGRDFYGEGAGDFLGYSIALSDDGSVVSMGAWLSDQSGTNAGHVRVYEWTMDGTSEEAWTQKGLTINGEAAADGSGWSVTMNHNGSTVGIGAITNDENGDESGHVRVFEFKNGLWVPKGQNINGENAGDQSGWSVSLDSSGSTVAIGAPRNEGNGNESGHVRVYNWVDTIWVQRGEDIDGESAGDQSGSSVSLNDAGTVVAIGSPNASNLAGMVRVYEWSDGEGWIKRGASIMGEEEKDRLGRSLSLNRSGDTVAIGAHYGGDTNQGIVYVYEWDAGGLTSAWNLIEEAQGKISDELFGYSVSISDEDALIFAAGGPDIEGGGTGVARVYKWS